MNFIKTYLFSAFILIMVTSCITSKEVKYMQPDPSLTLNEDGLIPYNIQEYLLTKNDILQLNIITTPKGDAAQFYSTYNTSGGSTSGSASAASSGSTTENGNQNFYFDGLKINSEGNIYVFGIGDMKAEGRTIESIRQEIQNHVNQNFLDGKSEVRLSLAGLTYFFLGDTETTGLTGKKVSYTEQLNILEAIAINGGLNKTVDRKNVTIYRKYPDGMKTARLDLTKEGIANSPYFWLQNGDMIMLNTRAKSIYGFGKDPTQTLTTVATLLTTVLTIYLLFVKF